MRHPLGLKRVLLPQGLPVDELGPSEGLEKVSFHFLRNLCRQSWVFLLKWRKIKVFRNIWRLYRRFCSSEGQSLVVPGGMEVSRTGPRTRGWAGTAWTSSHNTHHVQRSRGPWGATQTWQGQVWDTTSNKGKQARQVNGMPAPHAEQEPTIGSHVTVGCCVTIGSYVIHVPLNNKPPTSGSNIY